MLVTKKIVRAIPPITNTPSTAISIIVVLFSFLPNKPAFFGAAAVLVANGSLVGAATGVGLAIGCASVVPNGEDDGILATGVATGTGSAAIGVASKGAGAPENAGASAIGAGSLGVTGAAASGAVKAGVASKGDEAAGGVAA